MSSTNRGGVREEHDFYETREQDAFAAAESLRPFLSERPVIFEPMAGRGALVRLLRKLWPNAVIIANEINVLRAGHLKDAGADAVMVGDLFRPELPRQLEELTAAPLGLCFTNPAFKFAAECVKTCTALAQHTKILQRTNFLHSQERLAFWQRHRADLELLSERPHFAASITCIDTPICTTHRELHCKSEHCKGDGLSKRKACKWGVVQYLDDPRFRACPACGNDVRTSTSDSIEYSWFHFWPGASNTFRHVGAKQPQQSDLFGT